jgi:DnaJ-class molecular chaperone
MPRMYYERDEDWMVTCPECHGRGTIGTGDSRKRCPKCNEAGRIKR